MQKLAKMYVTTENGWSDNVTHMRYSEVDCGTGLPQWQRIAGNAAVVKGGRRDNGVQRVCSRDTAEKAIPQRQRNVEFAAVVDGVRVKLVPPEIEREAEDVNVLLLLVEVDVVDT